MTNEEDDMDVVMMVSSHETIGATTKEKFAGFKESVGTKMEELGAKLTGKGHQTKEQAELERKEALNRKSELVIYLLYHRSHIDL
jgi:hypothetical protein